MAMVPAASDAPATTSTSAATPVLGVAGPRYALGLRYRARCVALVLNGLAMNLEVDTDVDNATISLQVWALVANRKGRQKTEGSIRVPYTCMHQERSQEIIPLASIPDGCRQHTSCQGMEIPIREPDSTQHTRVKPYKKDRAAHA